MGYNQVNQNLQKNRSEMAELQNQAATQKRVTKPSDDPLASARVLGLRTEERGNKQYIKNVDLARGFLEASDQSLNELTESLMRAKELALQSANDAGGGPDTRRITALEIEQIHKNAVQIGNRKLGERYLFGGYRTTNAPFNPAGDYVGDDGDMKIQIQKDAFVSMNISGDKAFMGRGLSPDGFIRTRGTGPKNTDELKEYIQEENERIQKNNESEPENVEVRAPASASGSRSPSVYQDDATANVQGVNILKALKDLEIALKVNDKDSIQESIDTLDQSISQVIQARAMVGSRVTALNSMHESLQKSVVDAKTTASLLEDADIFNVVSEMQKADSTLKATLETSGRVIQPSLMDFLK